MKVESHGQTAHQSSSPLEKMVARMTTWRRTSLIQESVRANVTKEVAGRDDLQMSISRKQDDLQRKEIHLRPLNAYGHRGVYFAKEVDSVADAKVTMVPFAGWSGLGMCTPLNSGERSKAVALGLNPDAIYSVAEIQRHFQLKVAANARVKLGIRYESGMAAKDTASRFRVLTSSVLMRAIKRSGDWHF
jgi:hypothetical protein